MTPVPPDFREFLRLLHDVGVRYLLIGGYAVNIHGYARRTDDLDVWIACDPQNADAMRDALRRFGASRSAHAQLRPRR